MRIAVFVLGLALSAWALYTDFRRLRKAQSRLLPLEIHFVAAMISGAGAGLAWGSLWGLLVFALQAAGGIFAAVKLRT